MPRTKLPPIQPYEARVIRVPFKIKQPNGEFTTGMSTVGIRVELEGGEYFFFSTKHGTWTRHRPTATVTNRTGTNVIRTEERVSKFRDNLDLKKKLGHAMIEYQGQRVSLTHLVVKLRNAVMPKK